MFTASVNVHCMSDIIIIIIIIIIILIPSQEVKMPGVKN